MLTKKDSRSNGFTLIELVVVLVIMSFLFAIVGPAVMKGLSGITLKTAVKKVASALRYARSQAVNRDQSYSVIFDREQNRVVVRSIPNPAPSIQDEESEEESGVVEGEEAEYKKELSKVDLKEFFLPEGVAFDEITIGGKVLSGKKEAIVQLFFYPDGTSQGGELSIANTRELAFTIAVDFLTGVVTIAERET